MKMIELNLTPQIAFEKVVTQLEETAAFLAGLPQEERLDWLKK